MKHKCKSIQAIYKLKVFQPRFIEVLIVIRATVPEACDSQKSTPDPQKWQKMEYTLTSTIIIFTINQKIEESDLFDLVSVC
jgi:hypothetical protein